jgi:hypothetical protein
MPDRVLMSLTVAQHHLAWGYRNGIFQCVTWVSDASTRQHRDFLESGWTLASLD